MIIFVVAVLLFAGIGVYLIVRREEMSTAISMVTGASSVPGCAVLMGMVFLLIAVAAVVFQRLGWFGTL